MTASGFFYTTAARRQTSKAEQALLDAAFPWVITNNLAKETKLDKLSQRSKTAFLICKGQLQFERLSKAWPGNKIQHVRDHSSSRISKRHITTTANSAYSVKARRTEATFVEGQVCLSPELAVRLLERGVVRYYAEDEGKHVRKNVLIPLLEKTEFEGVRGKYIITIPGAKTDPIAQSLQDWFRAQWVDYSKKVKAQKYKRIIYNEKGTKNKDEAIRMGVDGDSDSDELPSDSAGSESEEDVVEEGDEDMDEETDGKAGLGGDEAEAKE